MTSPDLSDLLERAGAQTSVGAPPIQQMLTRARRRRHHVTAVMTGAAVTAVVLSSTLLSMNDSTNGSTQVPAASSVPDTSPGTVDTLLEPGNRSLAVGETAELVISVHCGLRYAQIDGTTWEVLNSQRTHQGGGSLIVGSATRASQDTVFFSSPSLEDDVTFRPSELLPEDYVCF